MVENYDKIKSMVIIGLVVDYLINSYYYTLFSILFFCKNEAKVPTKKLDSNPQGKGIQVISVRT